MGTFLMMNGYSVPTYAESVYVAVAITAK